MRTKYEKFRFRRGRTKKRLALAQKGRPRLCVHKSSRHIYAQVLDDGKGVTMAFASSMDRELKGRVKSGKNIKTAVRIGELVAKRALEKGVKNVCFDRGGFVYHGRIKAVAEAARKAGLKF